MERTTDPKTLNRDGYSMTLSLPRALMAIPILSFREALIISKIINLSSKYVDKGGCNLTNEQLAKRHRCSKPTVANAVSKAKWLGLQEARSDETKTFKTDNGDTAYVQNRRLKMSIPQVWEFFGEVWGEFYFNGCPAAEVMLDWLDENLSDMESDKNGEYLDVKNLLDKFHNQFFTDEGLKELDKKSSKGGILKIISPHLEKYKPQFEKLYALYIYGFKFSDLSFQEKGVGDSESDTRASGNGSNSKTLSFQQVLEYFPKEWQEDPAFQESLGDYFQHRKEKGNALKPTATKQFSKKLRKYPLETATHALNLSVENGWTGVFPESGNGNGSGNKGKQRQAFRDPQKQYPC